MKKILLSLAVLACGTAMAQNAKSKLVSADVKKASAELVQARTAVKPNKLTAEVAKMPGTVTKFMTAKGINRAGSDLEALYNVPTGAFCEGIEPGAGWYSVPVIYTPGLVEQSWLNYSSSSDESEIRYEWYDGGGYIDYETDEDGNGVASMFGSVYTPTLKAMQGKTAESEYQLGQNGTAGTGYWYGGTSDEYVNLGNAIFGNGQGLYSGFSDLNLNTNTPGESSGEPYFDGNIVGFAEIFEAPNDLYSAVSTILTLATEDNSNPAPLGGKELKCVVYALTEDGEIGDVIAEATATDENVTTTGDWLYSFEFTFTEDDPLFGKTEAPIVINGTDILVTYQGFENIATTFYPPFCHGDGFAGHGYMLLDNGDLSSVFYRGSYISQIDLAATLTAHIPVMKASDSMPQVVNIPAEGGWGVTVSEGGQDYNDYAINTLTPLDQWDLVECPEWLAIDTDEEYESAENGIVLFFFGADACEEPQAGNVVFECHGKQLAITIAQGDVDAAVIDALIAEAETINANGSAAGIQHVTYTKKQFNNNTYNVVGQKVAKNAKGIVISNGKKYMNK